MSARLTIEVTEDGSAAAAAALDKVGHAADDMGTKVSGAGDKATGGMSSVADSADNLDSKASQATGALGALAAGFELAGMEEYATGLQNAAMATDFLSGVGGMLNLVTESSAVLKAKDMAATVAATASSVAHTAATNVATAAQWALNAAMSANPIALIVLVVIALVAGFVLLYNKCDAFREAVDKAVTVAKAGIQAVIGVVKNMVDWLKDKVPPVWEAIGEKVAKVKDVIVSKVGDIRTKAAEIFEAIKTKAADVWQAIADKAGSVKDAIVGKLTDVKTKATEVWEGIKTKASDVWEGIKTSFGNLKDNLVDTATSIKSAVTPFFDALLAPINTAVEKVKDLIGWIQKIPGIPGGDGRKAITPSVDPTQSYLDAAGTSTLTTLKVTADPQGTSQANALTEAINALIEQLRAPTAPAVGLAAIDGQALIRLLRREGYLVGKPA